MTAPQIVQRVIHEGLDAPRQTEAQRTRGRVWEWALRQPPTPR